MVKLRNNTQTFNNKEFFFLSYSFLLYTETNKANIYVLTKKKGIYIILFPTLSFIIDSLFLFIISDELSQHIYAF